MFDLLSPVHIILLIIVTLLIFGPKKLPEMGAGLARGIREFRKAMNEISRPDVSSTVRENSDKPSLTESHSD